MFSWESGNCGSFFKDVLGTIGVDFICLVDIVSAKIYGTYHGLKLFVRVSSLHEISRVNGSSL